MSVRRIVGQNLLLSLFSVGIWSTIAWIACLIYGAVLHSLQLAMAGQPTFSMTLAMLHSVGLLPAFLGGGALLGLIAAQVQFWAWFTEQR
ncbi:MAG TPA: hypothetical protein VK191_10655 [Symbiobacteriaceae bacterium]|nr:hypothetical protein [Symbiobacteriaceae bacterium]